MTHIPFMTLVDGVDLDLTTPAPGHITAWDIAWALSQINRFTGRAIRPYSVAEHSLLVCDIAERDLGLNVHGQLAALLHDAHEAYTNDIATPAKALIGPDWYRWESRWERVVRSLFAVVTASYVYRHEIKQADLMALATERRDLMPRSATAWPVLADIDAIARVDLYSPERCAMTWEDWRDRWLDKYHELDFARNELVAQMRVDSGADAPAVAYVDAQGPAA